MPASNEQEWGERAGPGSDEDLSRRLAMASPMDTVRGLFLRSTLDAVRCLGDEEAVRDCQRASGEATLVDYLDYPISSTLRMMFTAAHLLAPRCGSLDDAFQALGYRAADGLLSSAAGMALQLVSKGDVKRLVDHLPAMHRPLVGAERRSITWTGPNRGRLLVRQEFLPSPFLEGMLLRVMDQASVRDARVRGQQLSTLESEYELSWEP